MQLVLSVGNKVLDRIDIRPDLVKDDEYIGSMQIMLLVKHELVILAHQLDPEFYIQVPSKFCKTGNNT